MLAAVVLGCLLIQQSIGDSKLDHTIEVQVEIKTTQKSDLIVTFDKIGFCQFVTTKICKANISTSIFYNLENINIKTKDRDLTFSLKIPKFAQAKFAQDLRLDVNIDLASQLEDTERVRFNWRYRSKIGEDYRILRATNVVDKFYWKFDNLIRNDDVAFETIKAVLLKQGIWGSSDSEIVVTLDKLKTDRKNFYKVTLSSSNDDLYQSSFLVRDSKPANLISEILEKMQLFIQSPIKIELVENKWIVKQTGAFYKKMDFTKLRTANGYELSLTSFRSKEYQLASNRRPCMYPLSACSVYNPSIGQRAPNNWQIDHFRSDKLKPLEDEVYIGGLPAMYMSNGRWQAYRPEKGAYFISVIDQKGTVYRKANRDDLIEVSL